MIALIGSHGVGKTTLLKHLSQARPDLIVEDGDSRLVRAYNKEIGNTLTKKEEQLLINRLSDKNWPSQVRNEKLCLTRTPLDHWAYSLSFGWTEFCEERKALLKKTDLSKIKFFYIPIEFPLEDDGVRYTDNSYQKTIDSFLKDLIEYWRIDATILSGTVEERLKKLLENI